MVNSFKEYIKTLEFPFCYYAYAIDREGLIDYFHYGLWESATGGIKEAQENLASMMKSLIPAGSRRILDVGCGLGRTTRDLTALGYDAIGISPDVRLMDMARAKYSECASRLIISSFEDYKSRDLFDLVLFQESSQYIKDLKTLFSHCKELLNNNGYILLCDEIRYEKSSDGPFHEKNKLIMTALEYGFKVVFNENITQKVLETRNFALRVIVENKDSITSEFSSVRENVSREIESLIEGWKRHTALFEKNVFGYEVILFQKCGSAPLKVCLYEKGDEVGITGLFQEVFGRVMSLDEWAWKYCERGKVYASVAKDETGNIVAHYGGMPKRMILNGREVSGLAIGDVMIHPKYRSFRLFKKIASMVPEEAVKDGIILGYGFPTERALQLPEKLGLYEKVEDVFEATKAVRFANDIRRFAYKLFPLEFDDDRIDILWESVKDILGLSVIRDSEYLERRYKRHPLFQYELWGLRKRLGSKLQGLAVLKREEGRMRIIDFICPLSMLGLLFMKIENYSSSAGSNELVLWIPEYLRDRMAGMGFSVRTAGTSIPRTTHERTLTKNEMAGRFFYTMGDTDFL